MSAVTVPARRPGRAAMAVTDTLDDTARVTMRKISFKPTSRKSSHGRPRAKPATNRHARALTT
jgi:hypothetical protein